jgi:hypothetical protein
MVEAPLESQTDCIHWWGMTSSAMPAQPGTPYGEFLAEQEEIQRLKWLASEREGHDLGFEYALNDWAQNHRAEWRSMRNRTLRQPV